MNVLLAALGGLITGAVGGFVLAIVHLQTKQIRDARLVRAGLPTPKDRVRMPYHRPGAVLGMLTAVGLVWVVPLPWAIMIGAAAPFVAFVVLWLIAHVYAKLSDSRR